MNIGHSSYNCSYTDVNINYDIDIVISKGGQKHGFANLFIGC